MPCARGWVAKTQRVGVSVPLESALVDANEKFLQCAHVHVALKLVGGQPDTQAVALVERGVGRVVLVTALVLQRAPKGQDLLTSCPCALQAFDVRFKLTKEGSAHDCGVGIGGGGISGISGISGTVDISESGIGTGIGGIGGIGTGIGWLAAEAVGWMT